MVHSGSPTPLLLDAAHFLAGAAALGASVATPAPCIQHHLHQRVDPHCTSWSPGTASGPTLELIAAQQTTFPSR